MSTQLAAYNYNTNMKLYAISKTHEKNLKLNIACAECMVQDAQLQYNLNLFVCVALYSVEKP